MIGYRSAGVVAAAQAFPLPNGSALQITVLEIASGSGQVLNRQGVAPDEEVGTNPETS